MSIRLRELIRAVRACKTAADEREVVAKESAALREAFREQDSNEYRHRNVAKLMYIHMLGYPTHFGQMETLKLIAAAGFPEKRIGYLGLMLLLDERQEVLMLVTNSLKMDLNHKNQYIAGLALAAFGNICSAEMARDLAPDIERLMECSNPYLKKKAAVCAIRVLQKVPELLESFVERSANMLTDKNHNVVLAATSLMLQICEMDKDAVSQLRSRVPTLCKILRSLLQAGNSPEHDVGGITDPFLQVKILRLLRHLGADSADASDQMSDILAQVAANIEGARNAGNAILYECVLTIMGVEAIGGLRVLAVNILGRFLANKDNNIRYVALNTLSKVVSVDTQAVQRHRATIVECVKDADVSIRRRALDLVYSLVNETNIKNLTRELLDYLAVSDNEFKPDLTAKICILIQRYSPDKRWHIDQLLQVMSQAGAHVKEEVCRSLIVLITNAPELHGYAVRSLYRNLVAYQDVAATSQLITAVWCIGEFGEMLKLGAGGALLEGEPPLKATDAEIVGLVESVARNAKSEPIVREYAVSAAMKLTARLPGQLPRLRTLVARYSTSSQLEVQARSSEFVRIFRHDGIRPQLLERMPALDEANYTSNLGGVSSLSTPQSSTAAPSSPAANSAPAAPVPDLLGLDLLGDDTPSAPTAAAAVNALDDLLGGGGSAARGIDLLDLLGGGAAAAPTTFSDIVAWQQPGGGVTVTFAFTKHADNPALTEILATYTNMGASELTSFNLQAAVPKFMQLRLEGASGSALPPNGAAPVQQRIYINNTLHGNKPLAMRLRISFTTASAENVVEQAEVANFPAGL